MAQAQIISGSLRLLCQEQLRSPQLPSWGNWRQLHSCRLRAELGAEGSSYSEKEGEEISPVSVPYLQLGLVGF